MMDKYEIIEIVWRQVDHHIEVFYASGDSSLLVSSHEVAAKLAADVGLILVPSRDLTVRWCKSSPTNGGVRRTGP
jgi:hypothetical protein